MMIDELDSYFDAVPRSDSRPVEVGAFTLFVSGSPFNYYARPARASKRAIVESDLFALQEACVKFQVPLAMEWVHETHPELAEQAKSFGLQVRSHALMVALPGDLATPEIEAASARVIQWDDPALQQSRAVADVSFTFGGTHVGEAGTSERDEVAARIDAQLIQHMRDRHKGGLTVTAVTQSDEGVIATGSYQRVGRIAEIVGVATLPVARHRGLGAAVTATLAQHAFNNGVEKVLLSAQDDAVARVYQRIGFRTVGSTGAAERG